MKPTLATLLSIALVSVAFGCSEASLSAQDGGADPIPDPGTGDGTASGTDDGQDGSDGSSGSDGSDGGSDGGGGTAPAEPLCSGDRLSPEGVEAMLALTTLTASETVYTTYDRIDGIAVLFEDCADPWGMFPTTYRHITNRIIEAIESEEIADGTWGEQIVLDFAGRYFDNLASALTGGEPSYAWAQYYSLAHNPEVSRTRAVVVAMVAHLTLDLPYALWAIDTDDSHAEDYFVLGELMIEITPDFIADLKAFYDTDAEDLLNGFFLGDWVDGVFGSDTTITLSYQTIRTKSWNNWRLLNSGWGWVASSEIYTSFWTLEAVLASLDAAGTI